MRYSTPIVVALLAACAAFNAHAAADSSNPCSLLDWQDFQSLGAVKDTPLANDGWRQEQTPKEIPDGKLWVSMCTVAIESKAGHALIGLRLESFKGKVTEQQVNAWLKSVASANTGQPGPDVAIVRVGDMTCESGRYDLPTRQDDDSVTDVVEHYIACDQQVGVQVVSLNVHVPEGKQGELPSPEQAKALLDKSIVRLKQQAFAPPEKLPL